MKAKLDHEVDRHAKVGVLLPNGIAEELLKQPLDPSLVVLDEHYITSRRCSISSLRILLVGCQDLGVLLDSLGPDQYPEQISTYELLTL